MDETQLPLTDHLTDLRRCLVISLAAVAAGFLACYSQAETLGDWFFRPLFAVLPEGSSLIFTSYQDAFFFYLKLALVGGVFLASPVVFWQIWWFVAPGLYRHEKRILLPFSLLSALCFVGGAAFGYGVVFRPAFRFLLGYATDYLTPLPAVKEYFSLAIRLLFSFGLVFELPIALVTLARFGIVDQAFLSRHRQYAILIAFVVAAILTPTPDVVNQLLMALPLVVLYEVGILAVRLFGRRADREEERISNVEQGMSNDRRDRQE
ncbi:MAG: twin-arginine translocase subunit TatC [Thermodesulfobacteriota bacterium]